MSSCRVLVDRNVAGRIDLPDLQPRFGGLVVEPGIGVDPGQIGQRVGKTRIQLHGPLEIFYGSGIITLSPVDDSQAVVIVGIAATLGHPAGEVPLALGVVFEGRLDVLVARHPGRSCFLLRFPVLSRVVEQETERQPPRQRAIGLEYRLYPLLFRTQSSSNRAGSGSGSAEDAESRGHPRPPHASGTVRPADRRC